MIPSFFLRPITRFAIAPPPASATRAGVAIVLIVRNEARHIAEWARFHQMAGVMQFFVYDNGSTDGTIEALRAALPETALTVIPWAQRRFRTTLGREIHNQVLAYAHALMNFGPACRWMAFIDVDEFLVPVSARSIPEAMQGLEGTAHVSLPWQMFGRGGHAGPPEGGVVASYTARARDSFELSHGLNFKCLVDPSRVTEVGVHGFAIDGREEGVNDAGQVAAHKDRVKPGFASRERLQLNHYYTRSDAELQAKIGRGSNKDVQADKHIRRVMRIVQAIEADTVEDRTAIDFVARLHSPQP
ncbi:glycosyltransferase family 92 protein [Tabrizicola oligotrophica]|uniref:Glycosyltransferase family 92 protein n=1 Tax=Tabrizicola oligotrophica TaxID=2710650 RepID=A0A6M0QSL5_9RHOB|nr:glycosyltransferase family 92 protein [Tabrizicola oligotrophica]NEY89623.1 glycosyltransferase family 92 protein [Tabrizicola oligotrophica]